MKYLLYLFLLMSVTTFGQTSKDAQISQLKYRLNQKDSIITLQNRDLVSNFKFTYLLMKYTTRIEQENQSLIKWDTLHQDQITRFYRISEDATTNAKSNENKSKAKGFKSGLIVGGVITLVYTTVLTLIK